MTGSIGVEIVKNSRDRLGTGIRYNKSQILAAS
jgi:hypothetical protein